MTTGYQPCTGDLYLDHDTLRPVFEAAAGLDVPLYIHPEIAPRPVRDVYFSDDINVILATEMRLVMTAALKRRLLGGRPGFQSRKGEQSNRPSPSQPAGPNLDDLRTAARSADPRGRGA